MACTAGACDMRILSAIVLLVWVLALLRTVVNLLVIHRLSGRAPLVHGKSVSIVVPARNEAREIEATLRAFLAQDYDDFEVILVDDRSTDGTGDIARAIGDPRLVVIDGEETPPGWLGKPWALQQGSRRARGELLLFVDADVHYEPATLRAAVAHLDTEPDVALLALLPRIVMRGFWEHIAMPNLAMFAYTMVPAWLANRTRIGILAVGAGTGNLVRRDVYERCGGHEALKDAVVDDVGLARLVRRNGADTEAVQAHDLVSVRMYHGGGEILRGFTKNAFAVLHRNYLLAAAMVVGATIVNLGPYVLALFGDPFAIAAVVVITVVRLIIFTALGYRLDNAFLGHPLMALFWDAILVRSIWKTGFRRELEWRGRTYDA